MPWSTSACFIAPSNLSIMTSFFHSLPFLSSRPCKIALPKRVFINSPSIFKLVGLFNFAWRRSSSDSAAHSWFPRAANCFANSAPSSAWVTNFFSLSSSASSAFLCAARLSSSRLCAACLLYSSSAARAACFSASRLCASATCLSWSLFCRSALSLAIICSLSSLYASFASSIIFELSTRFKSSFLTMCITSSSILACFSAFSYIMDVIRAKSCHFFHKPIFTMASLFEPKTLSSLTTTFWLILIFTSLSLLRCVIAFGRLLRPWKYSSHVLHSLSTSSCIFSFSWAISFFKSVKYEFTLSIVSSSICPGLNGTIPTPFFASSSSFSIRLPFGRSTSNNLYNLSAGWAPSMDM